MSENIRVVAAKLHSMVRPKSFQITDLIYEYLSI